MKTIRTLVISPNAPDTNSVWLYKGTMKYFNNGEWETVGGGATSVDWDDITNKPDFATVATSGSYNDLSDRPTIPPDYTLPLSTSIIRGGIKIGFTQVDKKYPVQLQNEQAFVEVPWTDTTYTLPAASTTVIGGVKKATNVANLASGAELAEVVTQVNAILSALKVADIMIND